MRGVQTPRISSVPPYASSSGPEAVRLALAVGINLDPWQQQDLIDGMGESADWKCPECVWRSVDPAPCPDHPDAELLHPWAAFEVVEVDPRQNGKSEIEVARELAGALIIEEPLQIYSAHLFDTAMEIFLRLEQVVLGSDDLRREVKTRGSKMVGIKHSHGEEGIEFRNGCRIRFKARTGSGGRGFTSDRLGLDEAMILPERFLGSTVPTLSAVPNPQLWFFGSAPDEEDPTHDGIVLAKRRKRALVGGDRSMAYFERSADWEGDPAEVPAEVLDDRRQWALANAALGTRISVETVANERAAMGDRQFAVERLGIGAWPDTEEDADRIITAEMWTPLADPGSRIHRAHAFALSVEPGQGWATISAAGEREDGLYHVGVVDHAKGVGWVVDRCKYWLERFSGSVLVVDPRDDLADLLTELSAEGIQPVTTSPSDYKDACGGFFRAIVEKALRYKPPQPELDAAVAGAKTEKLLNAWKWSWKHSTALISPLVSCTLALWGARTQGVPTVWNLADFIKDRPPGNEPTREPDQSGQRFIPLEEMPALPRTAFSHSPGSGSWGG